MALFDFSRPAPGDALEAVLDAERQEILTGNTSALPRFAAEKSRLLARLPEAKLKRQQLERLRRKSDHNQDLLAAMARGIRAVSERLKALKEQKSELRTYGPGGQAHDLAVKRAKFEKRA